MTKIHVSKPLVRELSVFDRHSYESVDCFEQYAALEVITLRTDDRNMTDANRTKIILASLN